MTALFMSGIFTFRRVLGKEVYVGKQFPIIGREVQRPRPDSSCTEPFYGAHKVSTPGRQMERVVRFASPVSVLFLDLETNAHCLEPEVPRQT